MENRFQEALDKVKEMLYDRYINDFGNEINVYPDEITILQELIDNYSKLEKALDIAIERLSNNYEILSGNKDELKAMIRASLFEESEKQ